MGVRREPFARLALYSVVSSLDFWPLRVAKNSVSKSLDPRVRFNFAARPNKALSQSGGRGSGRANCQRRSKARQDPRPLTTRTRRGNLGSHVCARIFVPFHVIVRTEMKQNGPPFCACRRPRSSSLRATCNTSQRAKQWGFVLQKLGPLCGDKAQAEANQRLACRRAQGGADKTQKTPSTRALSRGDWAGSEQNAIVGRALHRRGLPAAASAAPRRTTFALRARIDLSSFYPFVAQRKESPGVRPQ